MGGCCARVLRAVEERVALPGDDAEQRGLKATALLVGTVTMVAWTGATSAASVAWLLVTRTCPPRIVAAGGLNLGAAVLFCDLATLG
eukprot:gene47693-16220_t